MVSSFNSSLQVSIVLGGCALFDLLLQQVAVLTFALHVFVWLDEPMVLVFTNISPLASQKLCPWHYFNISILFWFQKSPVKAESKHTRTNFTLERICLFASFQTSATMKNCILRLIISLLCLHTLFVCGEDFVLMPVELAPVPCNDKAVEKLSRLAITYINEDRKEGYKFALNRITNVHLHAQGPAGNVYYLDLDVLETKCHTRSPKPWKRCDVRPFMETQISGNCNTTILHTAEGFSYLYSYDCALVPDAPEKLQQTCPTCPLLLSVDSPQAIATAQITLATYKRQSTLSAGLGVKNITRAASQTAGFCTGSLLGDMNELPDAQVSCEMFKLQNVDVVRPLQPQGHELLQTSETPTVLPQPDNPGNDAQPATADPPSPTVTQPLALDPTAAPQIPPDASTAVKPVPLTSSSSESEETLPNLQNPANPSSLDSSSEETGGPVALRPPFNFRYQRRDRKKRQALTETTPSHQPVFLSEFPSGTSPFRSCPGPSRYATV
uniref:Si:ch211-262h13.5 n=1 Tax=Oryzias sinensis TaxID=183150 RepID=A0A8C7WUE4_9TELE